MKGPSAPRPEFKPSSVCLAKMVQNFIEESNEKQPPPKCGRNRCNCFRGNSNDSSDDELDIFGEGLGDSISSGSFGGDASDILKSLIPCVSVSERNLLADTARIVDLRKMVTDGLQSLGYDSSTCKSKWEKSSSFPAETKTKDKHKSKHHKGDRRSKIWERAATDSFHGYLPELESMIVLFGSFFPALTFFLPGAFSLSIGGALKHREY